MSVELHQHELCYAPRMGRNASHIGRNGQRPAAARVCRGRRRLPGETGVGPARGIRPRSSCLIDWG